MADEGFLQRWSRRKAAARAPVEPPEPAQDRAPERVDLAAAPEPRASAAPADPRARDDAADVDLDALPDIDTLTYESDFTVFLRQGVPPELRRRALRRLWRSHPTLANLDGLVDYGGDYTNAGTPGQVINTAYQIGRGMLERIEPQAASDPPALAGARTTADTSQPPTTTAPAAPGPDRGAAAGADAAGAATAAPPEDAPRPRRGAERQSEPPRPAARPRPLPRRG